MYFEGSFTYGSYSSSQHNLVFARTDTQDCLTPVAEKSYKTLSGRANNKHYVFDSCYNDPLSFDTEIYVCDGVLSSENARSVCRSLFNSNTYKHLTLTDSEWSGFHLNCIIKLKEKVMGGEGSDDGIVGFKITILCDAPYAWKDDETVTTVSLSSNSVTASIDVDSDNEKYTYPVVIITQTTSNNANSSNKVQISIANNSDNNTYERKTIVDYYATDTLTINSETSTISSSLVTHPITGFSGYFPRLIPGTNTLLIQTVGSITGVVLTIKYRSARWIL